MAKDAPKRNGMNAISLKTKITVAVSVFVVGLISAGAFVMLGYFEHNFKKTVSEQQFTIISVIADDIDSRILNAQTVLKEAAGHISRELISDPAKARNFLLRQQEALKVFNNGLYIFNTTGTMVAEAPMVTERPGTDFSYREYFLDTKKSQKPVISRPYNSSQEHRHPAVMFTVPLFDARHEMIGLLTGSLDLIKGGFLEKLSTTRIGKNGYLYLYNTDRTMIIHPDKSRILKQDVPSGVNKPFDRAIEGFEGSEENVNSRGLRSLASFKRLKSADWIIGANFPVAEAYAHFITARQYIIAALFPIATVTIILVITLMNYLTAPLIAFARHVQELPDKQGDDKVLHLETGDEIGALAASFNRMVLELDGRERALQQQLQLLQTLIDAIPNPVFYKNVRGIYLGCNRAFQEFTGLRREEIIGKTIHEIAPDDIATIYDEADRSVLLETGTIALDGAILHADGTLRDTICYRAIFRDSTGTPSGIVGTIIDITERNRLENELRHSQKMEAVGRLAGGIAHDFNNILTAIIGYASILDLRIDQNSDMHTPVTQILQSAERAAGLTKGLLTYSRKQFTNPKPVDLNGIIKRARNLLASLVGEDVSIHCDLADEELIVMADTLQIEQVVMNLVTNARDAMPKGGKITVNSGIFDLDQRFRTANGFGTPGRYASLSVTDTGSGMDEATRKNIFEPFFTTKEVGQGTGLGLSIAYGIVKKHDGYIICQSEKEHGTTFTMYLPLSTTPAEQYTATTVSPLRSGNETILLAEDDATVRAFARTLLEKMGYNVIDAEDGEVAVSKFITHCDAVDLLILDVIMPKKNGKEAFDEIIRIRPGVKALFLSGYTADIINRKGILQEGLHFLEKPLSPDVFLTKIREVLES